MAISSTSGVLMPSATPTEAEIAAWRELPRDEQVKRMRLALTSAEASSACDATMAEIWAEVEAEAAANG
jgi:hypothetical protein